jgi:transcriptional regulator with XRE-family HTH domain
MTRPNLDQAWILHQWSAGNMPHTIVNFPVMPKILDKPLPNRVRAWRKRRGLTLQELAPRANLSVGHLGNLERGDRELTLPVLEKLAKELDCLVADLLNPEHGGLAEDERHIVTTYREVGEDHRKTMAAVAEAQQPFRHGKVVDFTSPSHNGNDERAA